MKLWTANNILFTSCLRVAFSTVNSDWLTFYLVIYVFINISYLNHLHTQALSDRLLPTADAGLQANFSCVFQSISWIFPPYEQHISAHDKRSLCFLHLTDLSIHKQCKTQASWVSATDSYGENHFLLSSCISRVIRITCLQTTYSSPLSTLYEPCFYKRSCTGKNNSWTIQT